MEEPGGPPRFVCPPDFSPSLFCPGAPFSQETLRDPSKELWLIRAPSSFSPESLEGLSVPLLGSQTLKTSQPSGLEKIFHVQTALEHQGGAKLLLPSGHGDHLTCAPPFSGSLSICERYGDPSSNQPLSPVAAKPPPQIPGGLRQRFLPFGNPPETALPLAAPEEPPRKKKKKKHHQLEEEDSKEQVPLLGEITRARGQHEVDGAAPLATGSAADAQNSVLSGETEHLAPFGKKKKRRREDRGLKGGEAETGQPYEGGGAPPSSTADGQDGPLSGEAEEPGPSSKKKKKKKRKEARELKEETKGEAEATSPHQVDGNPTPFAQDTLLSGEGEDPAPFSKKKKKKKRKEDGEVKEEVEAIGLHREDETALWGIGFQPKSEPVGQDGLPPAVEEDLGSRSKKKKKKKEGLEVMVETGVEAEAAHLPEENGTNPWGTRPTAHDGLLSSGAEDPVSVSKKKKKKKKKEGLEVKEEMGGEAEGLLGRGSEPRAQEDSLPGVEEATQGTQKEGTREETAASPELFSSQENAAGELWGFSGLEPTPEAGLVVAEEDPGTGSSSHKAKKKKRKKEKPEEAAQELEGWPAQQGMESSAELGTPLGGGGGGGGEQEAEPGREGLRQKRKKKERHKRQEEAGDS